MNILTKLLRKNLSVAQLTGFVIANFAGLAIVITGLQFFADVRALWEGEDSFVKKDYLVVNKRVKAVGRSDASTTFSEAEIADIRRQPWVRSVGCFTSSDYTVTATMEGASRSLSTYMFFEAVPSGYLDVRDSRWRFDPSRGSVPIIISKDYLTLYNFGFASSAGMPQISEAVMGSMPLTLRIAGENGHTATFRGEIVGFSNRLNTILVPEDFMTWSNREFGSGVVRPASRLIIDVNSPGDVAIKDYLEAHGLEQAGDKNASRAGFFLNIVTGVALTVGIVITALSLFILMLSISLLMQKNREKLHALIQLGYDLRSVGATYRRLVIAVSLSAYLLAVAAMLAVRAVYLPGVESMSGESAGLWLSLVCGAVLTLLIIGFNVFSVDKKVRESFR